MLSSTNKLFKPIYFQFGILVVVFVGLYFPFIRALVLDWSLNDNYSHGYIIPFISAFMIYSSRKELQVADIAPTNWGLPLIAIGLVQLVVAKTGSEFFLQRTSMILILFGFSVFFLGKKLTKKICIPLLYLVFMIPIPAIIWYKVALPMKLFASMLSEWLICSMGIPVLREGNIIHLAETSLEVVDACSGLRSLISMLALSSALAYLSRHSSLKKWLLFLSAAPTAVFVNVFRLALTGVLAKEFGEKVAKGFLHEFSGCLLFILGIMILIGVHVVLSKINIKVVVNRFKKFELEHIKLV